MRQPRLVPGAVVVAAACPSILVHALWLASWSRRPHSSILCQLLELELLLLLVLPAYALAAWGLGP